MIENECNKTHRLGWLRKTWLEALTKESPDCFYLKHTHKSGDDHTC